MKAWILALPLLAFVTACGNAGSVETLTFNCRTSKATGGVALVYEGDAKGTLTVKANFGEMTLPATKQQGERDHRGERYLVTGIRGFGNATIRMPDRAAIESCMTERGDTDEDVCADRTPDAATPITATAEVSLVIIDPPQAHLAIIRTFIEESAAIGGKRISIVTSGGCTITD